MATPSINPTIVPGPCDLGHCRAPSRRYPNAFPGSSCVKALLIWGSYDRSNPNRKASNMIKPASLLAAILLSLSQGCSTTWVEHRQTWNEGWRNGVVLKIDHPDPYAQPCLTAPESTAPTHYASVEYVQAKRRHRTLLPINDVHSLKQGEQIRFNRTTCAVITGNANA